MALPHLLAGQVPSPHDRDAGHVEAVGIAGMVALCLGAKLVELDDLVGAAAGEVVVADSKKDVLDADSRDVAIEGSLHDPDLSNTGALDNSRENYRTES